GVKFSRPILAGPTVFSAVGACPPHDGVRRRWWINVASAVTLSGARKKSGDLTTATVPAGTSFPAVSREPWGRCSLRGSLLLGPVELGSVDPHPMQNGGELACNGDFGLSAVTWGCPIQGGSNSCRNVTTSSTRNVAIRSTARLSASSLVGSAHCASSKRISTGLERARASIWEKSASIVFCRRCGGASSSVG